MSWRWQPPVVSPVSALSLFEGLGGAIGFREAEHAAATRALQARYDSAEAVLTDSGTSALVVALRAVLPPGGTVAYPAYACIDLTAAAIAAGVRVRLYDLDPDTLSPDLASVEQAIRRGVDGIVVAHLYGYAADVVAMRRLADQYGLPLIEDAAQGAGATLGGLPVGGIGDMGILSFGRGKGITCGSGGAILIRNRPHEGWIRGVRGSLGNVERGGREVAVLGAQWVLAHPSLYRVPASIPALKLGEMVYRGARDPRQMTASAAAMLPRALRLGDKEVHGRRERARALLLSVDSASSLRPVRAITGSNSGYLRLAVLDGSARAVPKPTLGVLRGYPETLEQHAQLQAILHSGERAGKGAKTLRDRLFTLPTHSRLDHRDLMRLREWIAAGGSTSTGRALS